MSIFHRSGHASQEVSPWNKPPVTTGELKINAPTAAEAAAASANELSDEDKAERFANPTAYAQGGAVAINGAQRAGEVMHETYDASQASVDAHPSNQSETQEQSEVA